jgi:hypothetical protein
MSYQTETKELIESIINAIPAFRELLKDEKDIKEKERVEGALLFFENLNLENLNKDK